MIKLSAPAILFVALAARLWAGPLITDDSFITLRYSQNLAHGYGLTFNPPARVLGTSSPLFAVGIAAPIVLHIDGERAAFAVSVMADLGTILVLILILCRVGFAEAGLIAAGFLATLPALVLQTSAGMETSLYTCLTLGTFLAISYRRPLLTGVIVGLATLTRPEGGLVALVAVVAYALISRREAIRCAVTAMVVSLPWLVWMTWYYGSPLPNSVVAKAANRPHVWISGSAFVQYFGHGFYLLLTALAVLGAAILWKRHELALRAALAWWLSYSLLFISQNAFGEFTWYFVPLLPLDHAAASIGIWFAVEPMVRRRPPLFRYGLCLVVTIAAIVLGAAKLRPLRSQFAQSVASRENVYRGIARQISQQDPTCAITSGEVGALGYWYTGPIVDMGGLVSPQLIGRSLEDQLRDTDACWFVADEAFPGAVPSGSWFRERFEQRPLTSIPVGTRKIVLFRRVKN